MLLFVCAACSKKSEVIGRWENEVPPAGLPYVFEFYKDGTYSADSLSGIYVATIEGDSYDVSFNGIIGGEEETYTWEKGTLELSGDYHGFDFPVFQYHVINYTSDDTPDELALQISENYTVVYTGFID